MRVRHVRNLNSLTSGYVCSLNTPKYINVNLCRFRRSQHITSTPAKDIQHDPSTSTFSDRIRSFLSNNPSIEEQDKAAVTARSETRSVQEPQLLEKLPNSRLNPRHEEVKRALIDEFFAKTEKVSRKELAKSVQARQLAKTRVSRRKTARRRSANNKKGGNEAGDSSTTENVNGRASTASKSTKRQKVINSDSKKDGEKGSRITQSRSPKKKTSVSKSQKTGSEDSDNTSRELADSKAPQHTRQLGEEDSQSTSSKSKPIVKIRSEAKAGKEKLIETLTSQITNIQRTLDKEKPNKKRSTKLLKDHAELVRQKEALVASDTDRSEEKKDEVVNDAPNPAAKSKIKVKVSENATARVKRGKVKITIHQADASKLKIQPVPVSQPPVPSLAYGLERVLFNPGIYQLQDPRSRVYNFDPYLQNIMPVADFDFNALKDYITSSKDEMLKKIAQEQGKRYVGSTSSMTSMLSHFHFLLSQWRPINLSMLSKDFPAESQNFTELQRCPSAIFLRWKDGTYAIDADRQFDKANILSMLGKSMEKLLTLPTDDFEKYRKSSASQVPKEEQLGPESYHYSTLGDFLMRSQLDAHDPRLPGTGMFDLKTRAVVSIRMNVENYHHGVGYQIKDRQGAYESFEREYYDMIRAAFLKYSMQVRMGRMDGIFVAFHNIERIFGFQYISLDEMDSTIHGQWDTSVGDQEFVLSLDLLNKILDRATQRYPQTSIHLHFETRDAATPFMYIFAEPVTEQHVDKIQSQNKAGIREFEREILGLNQSKMEDEKDTIDESEWDAIRANVQNTMDQDELGIDVTQNDLRGENPSPDEDTRGQAEKAESRSREPPQEDLAGEGPLFFKKEATIVDHSVRPLAADNPEEQNEEEDEDEAINEELNEIEDPKGAEGNGKIDNDHSRDSVAGRDDHLPPGDGEAVDEPDGGERGLDASLMVDSSDTQKINERSSAKAAADSVEEPRSPSTSPVSRYCGASEKADEVISPDPNESIKEEKKLGTQADAPFLEEIDQTAGPLRDVLAMTLTVRNKVNGSFVLRPENITAADRWSLEYSLVDVPDAGRARALYEACRARRKKKLDAPMPVEDEAMMNYYMRNLRTLSEQGRQWRKDMDEKDRGRPVQILGVHE